MVKTLRIHEDNIKEQQGQEEGYSKAWKSSKIYSMKRIVANTMRCINANKSPKRVANIVQNKQQI